MSVLRRHLSPDRGVARRLVVTEPEAYRFATDLVCFDLDRFDTLLEQSARQPTRAARASLEAALDLVRGEAFEDEPYAAWAADVRGSYQGRILGARLDAAELALAERDLSGALAHSEAAAALDRFSERAQRSEMLALYALGRGHEALDRYRGFRTRLDDELGLAPGAETRSLESAILRSDDVQHTAARRVGMLQATGPPAHRACSAARPSSKSSRRRSAPCSTAAWRCCMWTASRAWARPGLLEELRRELPTSASAARAPRSSNRTSPMCLSPPRCGRRSTDLDRVGRRLPALGQILPELRLASPEKDFEEVEALEALVAALAEQAPLVLLIDDLQWADPRTIAALGYLRRRGADLRVAIVTAASATETWPPITRSAGSSST